MSIEAIAAFRNIASGLEQRVAALAARVDELERASVRFCGVHVDGARYSPGAAVVRSGSLWIATRDTDGRPGDGADSGWVLAVKRGSV